ncbi:hypothetical protein BDN71DRAFT_1455767 [Pleurotus eryngii]|uniref:Uncharacterized protein n=1 Tax=Pleurotus eryngii TaxID=5323 RepID=A0A9P6DBE8_PLEER|nr:hypothetical protein BDN71DRAFT_1455767 [Pleurotus eryngii]
MLNISRPVLLAVYAALLSSNVSPMSSMLATASPIPTGLETRTVSNRLSPASRVSTYLARSQSRGGHAQPVIRASTPIDLMNFLGLDFLHLALTNCNQGREYNQRFSTLASNSPQDPANRQATIDLLEEIHLWLQSLALLLKPMGAAKGLLSYDRNSELETALKDLINVNKDLLKATYLLTVEDFPELADIVYDIKCILEFLLDFTENSTDGLINDLGLGL